MQSATYGRKYFDLLEYNDFLVGFYIGAFDISAVALPEPWLHWYQL